MAVEHRKDSIIELNKKKKSVQNEFEALGKGIAKLSFENMTKDKAIATIGEQVAKSEFEIMILKQKVEGAK